MSSHAGKHISSTRSTGVAIPCSTNIQSYYMFKLNRVGVAICSRYHHRSIVVATPERLKNSVDLDLQIACIDYNLYV